MSDNNLPSSNNQNENNNIIGVVAPNINQNPDVTNKDEILIKSTSNENPENTQNQKLGTANNIITCNNIINSSNNPNETVEVNHSDQLKSQVKENDNIGVSAINPQKSEFSLEKEIEISDVVDNSSNKESDEFKNMKTNSKNSESIVKPSNSFNFEPDLTFKNKTIKVLDKFNFNSKFVNPPNKKSHPIIQQISNLRQLDYFKKNTSITNPINFTSNSSNNNQIIPSNSLNTNTQPVNVNTNTNNYPQPSNININFNNFNQINNNFNFNSGNQNPPCNEGISEGFNHINLNNNNSNTLSKINILNNINRINNNVNNNNLNLNSNINLPSSSSFGMKKSFNNRLLDIYNELSSSSNIKRSNKESNLLSKLSNHNTRNSSQFYGFSNINSNSYQEQFDKFYVNLKSKINENNMISYPVNTYKGLHHINNNQTNNNISNNIATSNQYRYKEGKNNLNSNNQLNANLYGVNKYSKNNSNLNKEIFSQGINASYKSKFMNNPKFNKFEKIINNDFRSNENDSFNLKDEMVDLDEEIMNFKRKHISKNSNLKDNFNKDSLCLNNPINSNNIINNNNKSNNNFLSSNINASNNDINDLDSNIQFDENELKIGHEGSEDNNDWNNFIPPSHLEYSPVKEKNEKDD